MITAQNADYFRTPADVETFHRLGQRVAQLTYNFQNRIGAGFLEHNDGGLTRLRPPAPRGDAARGDDGGPLALRGPHHARRDRRGDEAGGVHARRGARPDARLCALQERRGAQGAGAQRRSDGDRVHPLHDPSREAPVTVEHVVDHIDYVIKLVGAEHVGIGSDLDMAGLGTPVPKGGAPLSVASQAELRALQRVLRRRTAGSTWTV
jgi:membrane dipeptidase